MTTDIAECLLLQSAGLGSSAYRLPTTADEAMTWGKIDDRCAMQGKRGTQQRGRALHSSGEIAQPYGFQLKRNGVRGRPFWLVYRRRGGSDSESTKLLCNLRGHLAGRRSNKSRPEKCQIWKRTACWLIHLRPTIQLTRRWNVACLMQIYFDLNQILHRTCPFLARRRIRACLRQKGR